MVRFCVSCELHLEASNFKTDGRARDGYTDRCLGCIEQNTPPKWKICSRCVKPQKLIDFPRHSQTKDKLHPECKLCKKKRDTEYSADNKDKISVQRKSYRQENKEAIAAKKKQYAASNRDKVVSYKKSYYQKNKDSVDKKNRSYAISHPSSRKRTSHKYYLKNKEYYKLRCAERNARKLKATISSFTAAELDARMSVFGYECSYCGGPFEHIEHAIPLIRGGYHCLANLRPSCQLCNLRKGRKTIFEFQVKS